MLLILFPDGLLNQFLMFGLCENSINTQLECERFYCAINSFYYFYWLLHEQSVCLSNVVFSIIISIRILICNYCLNTPTSKKLSKATRIALLDAIIVLFFNILTSYIFVHFPSVDFESIGPLATVTKTFGLVIEGLITCRVLFGDTQISSNVAS
nr:hypothetical protein Y102A5C.20 - Caenorhabditis elegans [Caenorhabditis elegans]